MSLTVETVVDSLPQRFPFRFVDQIDTYIPLVRLQASYDPAQMPVVFRGSDRVPIAYVAEGAAQATVLFVVLAVGPLEPGETPLLGSFQLERRREPAWTERLTYQVEPIRLLPRNALFKVFAWGSEGPILSGSLAVSRRFTDPSQEEGHTW